MTEKKPKASVSMQTGRKPIAPRRRASDLEPAQGGWPALHHSWSKTQTVADTTWNPKIDVFEHGKRLITRMDLPGVKAQDVTVSVVDGRLMISGERPQDAGEARIRFWRSERDHGPFHRAVPLPEGIQPECVRATFDGGVLEVSMPLPVQRARRVTHVPVSETSKAHSAA